MLNRREFIQLTALGGTALLLEQALPAVPDQKGGKDHELHRKGLCKTPRMPGFGETLLKNHFTLYQGYVTNTNKVLDALDQLVKEGKTATPSSLNLNAGWGGSSTA